MNNITKKEAHAPHISKKPIVTVPAKTVITIDSLFGEKLLCDGPVFSLGDSCVFKCTYCYVESVVRKLSRIQEAMKANGCGFQDIAIRRENALQVMESQLIALQKQGERKEAKGEENITKVKKVIYTSHLVDPAPNMEMAKETAEGIKLILKYTNWDVRVLSKSSLISKIPEMVGEDGISRVIYGVSLGTLDNAMAKCIEINTALASKRIKALHELQDMGMRTFGMACPILPQVDPDQYVKDLLSALRVEKLEHVWAEVLNARGSSIDKTISALREGKFISEANLMSECKDQDVWEAYSWSLFDSFANQLEGTGKLRFLQYVKASTEAMWSVEVSRGAVLLGRIIHSKGEK